MGVRGFSILAGLGVWDVGFPVLLKKNIAFASVPTHRGIKCDFFGKKTVYSTLVFLSGSAPFTCTLS